MIRCPLCKGGPKGTDYRSPIKVPEERPYETVYVTMYIYNCLDCDETFAHPTFDPD